MNEVLSKRVFTRKALWEELRARGWPLTHSYFNWLCCVGQGPVPVGRFGGQRPIYTLEEGLRWATERTKGREAGAKPDEAAVA
jgi:hypothetical protein